MRILNIMLEEGVCKQAMMAVSYAAALRQINIECINITTTQSYANTLFDASELPRISFDNWGRFDPLATFKLWHLARHHQADLLLCHGDKATRFAIWAMKGRIPITAVAYSKQLTHALKADTIFCTTKAILLEAELLDMPKERLVHIPPAMHMPEQLQPHTLYQRRPVIGAMGGLTRENGFDNLLQAAAVMNQRGLRYEICIAGDGEELPNLKARTEELGLSRTVSFLGFEPDIDAFFGKIDVFVSPAHYKLVGHTLMQAMARGLACVTTDTEGPGEIVHHGEDICLVERNNPEALALGVERVLSDPEFASIIAQGGQQLIARHYSIDAMVPRLQSALQSLPIMNAPLNIAA